MRYMSGMSTGWKIFWTIILSIFIACIIFGLSILIASTVHNISFVEEFQQIFGIAKEVTSEVPVDSEITSMFLNLIKI